MVIQQIIREIQALPLDEQKELIKILIDLVMTPPLLSERVYSLQEFRGVGAHAYEGVDAQDYVNQLRSEWDERS
jgi:uncharacterized protein YutE (UPF0331/DUF86 family)